MYTNLHVVMDNATAFCYHVHVIMLYVTVSDFVVH